MSDWFCTVFPNDTSEMPQDFPSYEETKEYGDETFGAGNYTIESPCWFMPAPEVTRAERKLP